MTLVLTLQDASLYAAFGVLFILSLVICSVSSLLWSLNFYSKPFGILFLLSLAYILEINPALLRVVPGYIGWIVLISFFIPNRSSTFFTITEADRTRKLPNDIYSIYVGVICFSFLFSAITKLQTPFWLNGSAYDIFSYDIRTNWLAYRVPDFFQPFIKFSFNYVTIALEIFFPILYIHPKLRKLAWLLLALFFSIILITMNIYVVALGMLLVSLSIYPLVSQSEATLGTN